MSDALEIKAHRRFQFTLKRMLLAALWVAVCVGGVIANRYAPSWDFRGLESPRKLLMYATFYIGGASPFIAVGALLGRPKAGALVGFVAVSALLAVVTSLALFDSGMNQSTGETGRRIADCTTSWILLVLGVVAALMNSPQRRWFRFSLRTMFVLVAVFGCWLGYEMNWIRQRRAFAAREDVSLSNIHYDIKAPPGRMSISLLLLGEKRRECLGVLVDATTFEKLTDDDCRRAYEARRLFPEARVWFRYVKGGDASRNWAAPLDDYEPYLPKSPP